MGERCAACGMPGHRYGRNEGMDRYDPMACINTLRGEIERLRSGPTEQMVEAAAVAAQREAFPDGAVYIDADGPKVWEPIARAALVAAFASTTEEET